MAQIIEDTPQGSALDVGSTFWEQQLKSELFKQRIRRDARRIIEDEAREHVAGETIVSERLVYDPLPTDAPELIPGLLPEYGAAAIVGETNTGKSLIALEIASSLLTGDPLWGAIKPNRTIGKVVYILGEHTPQTLQGLFHRTQLPHKGDFRLIGPDDMHPHKALVVSGVQQGEAVERMIKITDGANLIVFDPIAGFVQGQSAENDNATMRTLIDAMSLVAMKNKAACLVLAHAGKPRMDESGREVRRVSYVTRGASAVEDAFTHIFYLRKSMTVKQQNDEERFELVIRKFKGNPSDEIFRLRRDGETKRNSLLDAKRAKTSYPNLEEKLALAAKVQRVMENNPKFNAETALRLVADMEDLPTETIQRWLTTVA